MVICQGCQEEVGNPSELSLYQGRLLCQPCIRAGLVVGGRKSKGVESLHAPDKRNSEVIATNVREPAPRPLPIGEHKRANPRLRGEGIPQPNSCAPQWQLPALCLTTVLPNGNQEPEWDKLKQVPFWLWAQTLSQTVEGWLDPYYKPKDVQYYRWRTRINGKFVTVQHLGKSP